MASHTGSRITRRGFEIAKGADARVDALVRRELTVSPVSLNDPFPKKFRVYLETPTRFIVPAFWAATHGLRGEDVRGAGESVPSLEFQGSLRADLGQPQAVAAVLESWERCGGAMLCTVCGGGKTTMALHLVCALKRKALVVVHTTMLKDQWKERIAQFVPAARVTEIQGSTCDTSGDVVVAMIQTLVSRAYPASTFEAFGVVVADESHHVAAPTLSQAMFGLNAPRMLGLTATPHRKDGLSRVVEWILGPVAFLAKRTDQIGTHVRVVPYACAAYELPMPTNRRGDVCFVTTISRLVENGHRTQTIARLVADLVAREDRHVLVLSHRRQHCADLAAAVRALGVDAGTYVGGDKQAPDTRVIVATYALTSEGFDMPRLNALVLATPASDVEQSCGRVMRGTSTGRASAGGNGQRASAIIVDVVDQWGLCHAQHAKRRGFYKRSGFRFAPGDPHDAQPDAQPNQDGGQGDAFAFLDDDE